MPCTEFTDAIAWSKKTIASEVFPVSVYFTKHFGGVQSTSTDQKDSVHYASGSVVAVDTPSPHLAGILRAAKNTELDGQMVGDANLTYDVKVFPDGTLSYLMKIKGNAVGGMPPTVVQATCVNGRLLTATTGTETVAIGVARRPSFYRVP